MKLMKYIIYVILFDASLINAAEYTVSTGTSTVDGDTFCGGSTCTSADTIIIEGGARGSLRFMDFDGNGSYITITNEDTNRVVITHDAIVGFGVFSFWNCKYIDVRGNNNGSFVYGILAENDGSPNTPSGTVWVYGESDHVKLGYIEVDYPTGAAGTGSSGIKVQDSTLTSAWTFDTFEIHHNYIHDTRYSGMYLGHNTPHSEDNPYVANFSVHDNILEDLGTYGFNLKGVEADSTTNYIYNNTIKRTGVLFDESWYCKGNGDPAFCCEGLGVGDCDSFLQGISLSYYYDNAYAEVYGNWIEKTEGMGIRVTEDADHLIHGNIIVGCGWGNSIKYGHGIYISRWNRAWPSSQHEVQIYDNTIVEATRYGISDRSANSPYALLQRNIIAESGIGEWESPPDGVGGNISEGSGADANIYEADADDIGFRVWIDDGDYSNDDFTIGDPSNTAPIVNAGTDQSITLPIDTVSLNGIVTDDGLPDPPAAVTTTWTKQSGPGTVAIADENAVDTTASFSSAGTYVLRLTADDSDLQVSDDVTITVNGDTTPPAKPTGLDIIE